MLCYLLTSGELLAILERLGCPTGPDLIPRTIRYYLDRTSHGSTLSAVVHSQVLAAAEHEEFGELLGEALMSDIKDVQGGTTEEGIHLGAMAGTLDLLNADTWAWRRVVTVSGRSRCCRTAAGAWR